MFEVTVVLEEVSEGFRKVSMLSLMGFMAFQDVSGDFS